MFWKVLYKINNIIILTIAIVWFWQSTFSVQILQTNQWDTYTKLVTTDIEYEQNGIKIEDRQLLPDMKKLCNNIIDKDFNIWTVTFKSDISNTNDLWVNYKAQESLFVTIICNSLLSDKASKTTQEKSLPMNNIIKNPTIRSLWVACLPAEHNTITIANPDCDPRNKDNANTIDLWFIFYNVAIKIINDISNLMIAREYGATNSESTPKILAEAFIENHFNTPGFRPESKFYPQTYNKLKEYITIGKNIQKSTLIIDMNKLKDGQALNGLDMWRNFLVYDSQNTKWANSATETLSTYQWIGTDLIYNELFFYTLFSQIYSSYLNKYRSKAQDIPIALQQENNINNAIEIQRARIASQQDTLLGAVTQTIRQINTTTSSFPIHIGLLMYQEDLLTLRNNFAKIYLPLHQLHYKLENIQSKE